MAAKRQVDFDPLLERAEPKLLEAADLRLGERLVCEVGERRPAPETESIAKEPGRDLGRCFSCFFDQPLEPE